MVWLPHRSIPHCVPVKKTNSKSFELYWNIAFTLLYVVLHCIKRTRSFVIPITGLQDTKCSWLVRNLLEIWNSKNAKFQILNLMLLYLKLICINEHFFSNSLWTAEALANIKIIFLFVLSIRYFNLRFIWHFYWSKI